MPRILSGIVLVSLGTATLVVAQLPPEILADQYLLQADQQMAKKDHEGALVSLQKLLALQEEHGLTVPEAFHVTYVQVAFAAESFPVALESVNQYLLMLAIQAADRTPCAGQPKGTECWLELPDQAGCHIWNPQYDPTKSAAWTGECSGGLAQGQGILNWVWDGGQTTVEALITDVNAPRRPLPRVLVLLGGGSKQATLWDRFSEWVGVSR